MANRVTFCCILTEIVLYWIYNTIGGMKPMGMYDRDWYRESYKEKEEKYGGDFSLHSKPKKKHQKKKADKAKNYSTYQESTYRNSAYQNTNKKQDDSLLQLINISCPILFVITLLWGYKFIPNQLSQIILECIFFFTPFILKEPKGTRLKSIFKAIMTFIIALIVCFIVVIGIIYLLEKFGILKYNF